MVHYEIGIHIGELSLPAGFDGLLVDELAAAGCMFERLKEGSWRAGSPNAERAEAVAHVAKAAELEVEAKSIQSELSASSATCKARLLPAIARSSLNGKWVVKRRTAKDRFSRTLRRIGVWCRTHLHDDVEKQHRALARKLNGHYAYFGITSNYVALARLLYEVIAIWRKWLCRRSQKGYLNCKAMHKPLERYPLPRPRIGHLSSDATSRKTTAFSSERRSGSSPTHPICP